jgi:hypothetical protein
MAFISTPTEDDELDTEAEAGYGQCLSTLTPLMSPQFEQYTMIASSIFLGMNE